MGGNEAVPVPSKSKRSSELYQITAYFNDDDLAERFEAFAEEFGSESKAALYCIRSQLQRDMVNDE